jgi:DNA invertase Pin-like site-specific DNA recombinase
MMLRELPSGVVARRAIVYVRQSTSAQVRDNLESQQRQYDLAKLARAYGFADVKVVDDDLGRSASSTSDRPGFRALVGEVCEGVVGAVFCLEASRLARNGRDWHHLLELCGLVGARVIDVDGAYDPGSPNDRLLLGLKGTMSEFELTVLRRRLLDAVVAKAKRGELRIGVPIGYVWDKTGLAMDPDRRVQESIRSVFRLFERLGSARQVLLYMREHELPFPRPSDGKHLTSFTWRGPIYRNVISVLSNPFYAGAYAYGKSRTSAKIIEGTVVKRMSPVRARDQWTALIRDHHEAYVTWEEFEKNQVRLSRNTFCKRAGGAKSGRGGRALMPGLLRCRRCGRMLHVTYGGQRTPQPRYACRMGNAMHGLAPCITFGARRPDDAVARALLLAVQPLAIEAALVAERDAIEQVDEHRRALELEIEQARYEAALAARRYEAVDPDNRLVASELEERWNAALTRLKACEEKARAGLVREAGHVDRDDLLALADDLSRAWSAPTTTMRTKQQLVRALVEEIVVDVDDRTREVVLLIHWRGGRHSELRVRKPETGEHTKRASDEVDAMIREMATRWSDENIAATLNRMGFTTGAGNTWNARRVASHRHTVGIDAYASAPKDGQCLTMFDAAKKYGVPCHVIRRLIKTGVLPARQVMFDAPWQILASDLERDDVQRALRERRRRGGRPCRSPRDTRTLTIPGT